MGYCSLAYHFLPIDDYRPDPCRHNRRIGATHPPQAKYRRRPKYKRFPIAERTSIHSRLEQADGKRFGDFEMDLIVDAHNHAILTIVERSTNMLFMTKLAHGKKSEPLAKAVRRLLLPYKKHIKTITTDNGPEFAAHKLITKYLGRSFISPILMPYGKRER